MGSVCRGGADGVKKTTRAGLAMCFSLDSKIVAVDFLFACIECYEFGVEEVASVGKDRDEVGRGRGRVVVGSWWCA